MTSMVASLVSWIALAAAARPAAPVEQLHVKERVEVQRVVLDVRVVDARGDPVRGLSTGDFRVRLGGVAATLEAVEWVAGTEPYAEGLTPEEAAAVGGPVAPAGRLIVYFFQTDFAPVRLNGLMGLKARAIRLLDTLGPGDRVAVVSFDSHLKLRQDFTSDRAKLVKAIHAAILYGREPDLRPGRFPSLARSWDRAAARRAAEPETGLLVTADALAALPGAKSLVFFGWGLGHLVRPWVVMGRDYDAARRALQLARVSVFAIDVTDADFHDLEVGLERVAADTGGFYAKTNLFPGQAIARVEGAIAGRYVLTVVKPDLPRGPQRVEVGLTRARGTVLVKPFLQD